MCADCVKSLQYSGIQLRQILDVGTSHSIILFTMCVCRYLCMCNKFLYILIVGRFGCKIIPLFNSCFRHISTYIQFQRYKKNQYIKINITTLINDSKYYIKFNLTYNQASFKLPLSLKATTFQTCSLVFRRLKQHPRPIKSFNTLTSVEAKLIY